MAELFSHGVEVGRFVDGLKSAGVESFVGVRVKFTCGCDCTDRGVCPLRLYQ